MRAALTETEVALSQDNADLQRQLVVALRDWSALQAEVERLKADIAERNIDIIGADAVTDMAALQRRHDALREAAEPFVNEGYISESMGNATVVVCGTELRALRAALDEKG